MRCTVYTTSTQNSAMKKKLAYHISIGLPVIEHSLGHKLAQELELVPDLSLVGGLGVPRQGQRI